MKIIARHLNLVGLLLLAAFSVAAAGLYFQTPASTKSVPAHAAATVAHFVCPMHPNVTSATQGDCPECGMKLVALGSAKPESPEAPKSVCCAEKPAATEPAAAMTCPHLAAMAAQAEQPANADSCCSKPAKH